MTGYKYFYIFILMGFAFVAFGQGSAVPLGNEAYSIMDRLAIKTGIKTPFFNSVRPYLRGDLTSYAIQLDSQAIQFSARDRQDLRYIFLDNNEWLKQTELPTTLTGKKVGTYSKVYVDSSQTFYTLEENTQTINLPSSRYIESKRPLLRHFYKTPANLFEINEKYFQLKLNPILHVTYGREKGLGDPVFYNRRGLEIRGGVDDRIYFYSNILETQASFPNYVRDWIDKYRVVPGAGLFKNYESSVFDISKGYDFLLSQGYIGFNVTSHVGVQFGHGRNFIGNGYRSLFLSDFANNYFYLKFNTRVWKLHYQNIFAELSAEGPRDNIKSGLLKKKYMAAHYLSYRPIPTLRFGFYEAIIYNRSAQFELQYLNPIILYRTIEHGLDSPDNALLGLDFSWDILKRFQLYGQLMLDEFKFDEVFIKRDQWWGNKHGIQLGLKYIDVLGIDHLDIQLELNIVRPYTYQHRDSSANYTHYNQALAHPLGANFKEYLINLRYPITKDLVLKSRIIWSLSGEDDEVFNYGGNLLRNYGTRVGSYGITIGQGIENTTLLAGVDLSYRLAHNIFLDFSYLYRKKDSDLDILDKTDSYFEGGIRMNIARQNNDF